jgi:hypothetical protein
MKNGPYKEIENLARLMDDQFEIFGFKFGLNFILDWIPEIGDIVSTSIALYVFSLAQKYQISAWIKFRMLLNIAIFFIVGLVPGLGDLFGAWWKPNRKNVELLRRYAGTQAQRQALPAPG